MKSINQPYKYKHTYNCLLENKRNVSIMRYVLHSDWPRGKDKRNIAELKKRLGFSMIGIKLKNAYHIRSKMIA